MNLLTADDLERLTDRARIRALAVVSGSAPRHLLPSMDDAGLAVDQVLFARLQGMADALGTLVATLPAAGDRLTALLDRARAAYDRGVDVDVAAARGALAVQLAAAIGERPCAT